MCRRQLPHSGFPLVGDPPPPLKNLACPPTHSYVPYYFDQKTLFYYLHAVFSYGQNVPPTNRVFATVGDGKSPTSQKFAHPPTWKNSSSRLHQIDLVPNFQIGGLERISILKGGLLGKRGWPFSGGCSFYIKSVVKFETFNDKKVHKQKCFSLS